MFSLKNVNRNNTRYTNRNNINMQASAAQLGGTGGKPYGSGDRFGMAVQDSLRYYQPMVVRASDQQSRHVETSKERRRAAWDKPKKESSAARFQNPSNIEMVTQTTNLGQSMAKVTMTNNKNLVEEWMPDDEFFSSDSSATENQDMEVGRESSAEMTPKHSGGTTQPIMGGTQTNIASYKIQQHHELMQEDHDGAFSRQIVGEHRSEEVSSKRSGQKLTFKQQRSEDQFARMKLSQAGVGQQILHEYQQTSNNFASSSQVQGQNNANNSGSQAQGQQRSRPSLTNKDPSLANSKGKYGFEASNVRFHPNSRQKTPHTPIPHQGANDSGQFLYQSNIIIMAGNKDDDPEDADQADDEVADENNAGTGTLTTQNQPPSEGPVPETMTYHQESKVQQITKNVQRLAQQEEKGYKYLVKNAVNTGRQYDFRSHLYQQNSHSNTNSTSKQKNKDLQVVDDAPARTQNDWVVVPPKNGQAIMTPRHNWRQLQVDAEDEDMRESKHMQLRTCRSGDPLPRNLGRINEAEQVAQASSGSRLEQFLQIQEQKRKNNGSQFSESFVKNQWQFQRKTPSRRKRGDTSNINNPNQSSYGRQQSGIFIGQRAEHSPEMPMVLKQNSPSNFMVQQQNMTRSYTASNLKAAQQRQNNRFEMNKGLSQFTANTLRQAPHQVNGMGRAARHHPLVSPTRQGGTAFGSASTKLQPIMSHSHLVLSPSHQKNVKPFPSVAKLDSGLALKQSFQIRDGLEEVGSGQQRYSMMIQHACPNCNHHVDLREQHAMSALSVSRQKGWNLQKVQKHQQIQPKVIGNSPKNDVPTLSSPRQLSTVSNGQRQPQVSMKLPQKVVNVPQPVLEQRSQRNRSQARRPPGGSPYADFISNQQQQSQTVHSRDSKLSSTVQHQIYKASSISRDQNGNNQRDFSASSSQVGSARRAVGATQSGVYLSKNQQSQSHDKSIPIYNQQPQQSAQPPEEKLQSQVESTGSPGTGASQLRQQLRSPKRLNLVKKSYRIQHTRGSGTEEGSNDFNQLLSNGAAATVDNRNVQDARSISRGDASSRQGKATSRVEQTRAKTKDAMLDRFEKYEQKKEMKLFLKKIQQQENEMDGCSFQPKIETAEINGSGQKKPRDIQQFVKDQQAFLENKQAKENILRQQKEQDELSKSRQTMKFNKKSQQILKEKQKRELVSADYQSFVEEMKADGVYTDKDVLKLKPLKSTLSNELSITGKKNPGNASSSIRSILQSEVRASGSPVHSSSKLNQLSSNVSPAMTKTPREVTTAMSLQKPLPTTARSPKQPGLPSVRSVSSHAAVAAPAARLFLPKINKNTDQLLENRRKRKLEEENKLQDQSNEKDGSKGEATTLKQSDRYLISKFNREFILAVESMRREFAAERQQKNAKNKKRLRSRDNLDSPAKSHELEFDIINDTALDYEMYKSILFRLGMIQDTNGIDRQVVEKQEKLLYVLWKILGGCKDLSGYIQEFQLQPLVQFICRLVDGKHVRIDISEDENMIPKSTRSKKEDIPTFNFQNDQDDDVTLSIVEILKLQKYFYTLYINRQQLQGQLIEIRKTIRAKEDQKLMTFQPKLISKQIDYGKTSPMSRAKIQHDDNPYQQKLSQQKQTPTGNNIAEGSFVISRIDASSNFGSSNQISNQLPESAAKSVSAAKSEEMQVLADIETVEQKVAKQAAQDKPKPVKSTPKRQLETKKSTKIDLPKEEAPSRTAPQANIPIQISEAKSNAPSTHKEPPKKVTKSKYNALFQQSEPQPAKRKDPKPVAKEKRPRDESPDGEKILARVDRRMEKHIKSETQHKQSIIKMKSAEKPIIDVALPSPREAKDIPKPQEKKMKSPANSNKQSVFNININLSKVVSNESVVSKKDMLKKKMLKRNQTATTNIGVGSQMAIGSQQMDTQSNMDSNQNEKTPVSRLILTARSNRRSTTSFKGIREGTQTSQVQKDIEKIQTLQKDLERLPKITEGARSKASSTMSKRCRSNTLITQDQQRLPNMGSVHRDNSIIPLSLQSVDDVDQVQSIKQIEEVESQPVELKKDAKKRLKNSRKIGLEIDLQKEESRATLDQYELSQQYKQDEYKTAGASSNLDFFRETYLVETTLSPVSAKIPGDFAQRTSNEIMKPTARTARVSEFMEQKNLRTVKEERDFSNEQAQLKSSKSNRFSLLFKDGGVNGTSFAMQQEIRSDQTRDNQDIDYDNIGKGTETDRVLSARKEYSEDNMLKNFENKFERMLKLEIANKARKAEANQSTEMIETLGQSSKSRERAHIREGQRIKKLTKIVREKSSQNKMMQETNKNAMGTTIVEHLETDGSQQVVYQRHQEQQVVVTKKVVVQRQTKQR